MILDGELVCFGEDGNPDFERLRGRLCANGQVAARAARAPATFLAFDLLHLDRHSALAMPYQQRRKLLGELPLEGSAWRTSRNFIGQAGPLLAATAKRGLEGVVAKRLDSPYTPGTRTSAWIKHKHRPQRGVHDHGLGTRPAEATREFLPRQAAPKRQARARGRRLARPDQ